MRQRLGGSTGVLALAAQWLAEIRRRKNIVSLRPPMLGNRSDSEIWLSMSGAFDILRGTTGDSLVQHAPVCTPGLQAVWEKRACHRSKPCLEPGNVVQVRCRNGLCLCPFADHHGAGIPAYSGQRSHTGWISTGGVVCSIVSDGQ